MVFLIFVGIATFFWFLRALEQTYISQIEHPVIYTNLPDKKILVKELPRRLSLEVEGTGFAILRHNWDISKNPVRINFEQIYKNTLPQSSQLNVSIPTIQLKPKIASQLNKLRITSIKPDSIDFSFSGTLTRKVPILLDLELGLEKQFMIRDQILISPDSIDVTGPAIILDTLRGIYTANLRFKNLDHSIIRNIGLVKPDEQLRLSEKRVVINVPIEQYTEKSLSVPIEGINLPDSLHLKTFPAQVQLKFRVVISAFDAVRPDNFKVIADYLEIDPASPAKIKPQLILAPSLIENPTISPELVDYLLEKK